MSAPSFVSDVTTRPQAFKVLALAPPLILGATAAYAQRFDGWGAWATAPLFLLPVALSAVVTVIGVMVTRRERADGSVGAANIGFTVLAAVPLLWFGWRLLVTS